MHKRFIIYGFGRMGLTHYAILNQLLENAEFVFVDPNKKVNFFAQRNINARVVDSIKNIDKYFDFALICTPPIFHLSILEKCINSKIPNIFVEKPFGGLYDNFSSILTTDSKITIGYVLRFNPIIQWVKDFINKQQISKVEGYYFSNTIEKKPKGWRNGFYSGVTNEVGSHIIDLFVFLFDLSNPQIINKQLVSVISDVDDILTANLFENNINYHLHFDWVNKNYRKPVFKFVITLLDGTTIKFDQQKLEHFKKDTLINQITTVDLAQNVPYYLRGIDFTLQMQDFIGEQKTMSNANDAILTRNLINRLIS